MTDIADDEELKIPSYSLIRIVMHLYKMRKPL